MAKPTRLQKRKLGPLVGPFERHNRMYPAKTREIGPGEDRLVDWATYDATQDGQPDMVRLTDKTTIDATNKYIWVIMPAGLFMAFEETEGPNLNRRGLCHSNLTGGKKAYQGGELCFHRDGSLILNFKSGRYGAETDSQKEAVLVYFQSVGYQNVIVEEEQT